MYNASKRKKRRLRGSSKGEDLSHKDNDAVDLRSNKPLVASMTPPAHSEPSPGFHSLIYILLWGVGIASSCSFFFPFLLDLGRSANVGDLVVVGQIGLVIFAILNYLHIGFAYLDFYRMEEKPEYYSSKFSRFFGTWQDKWIRGFAFLCLLTSAGKLWTIVEVVRDGFGTAHPAASCGVPDCNGLSAEACLPVINSVADVCRQTVGEWHQFDSLAHSRKLLMFLGANFFLFFLFLLWDFMAGKGIRDRDAKRILRTYKRSDSIALLFSALCFVNFYFNPDSVAWQGSIIIVVAALLLTVTYAVIIGGRFIELIRDLIKKWKGLRQDNTIVKTIFTVLVLQENPTVPDLKQ